MLLSAIVYTNVFDHLLNTDENYKQPPNDGYKYDTGNFDHYCSFIKEKLAIAPILNPIFKMNRRMFCQTLNILIFWHGRRPFVRDVWHY
uniref:Uncharacterized protein n=1 Tax=Lactuca sativa TaxID=4236 RepID=A0A9R1VQX9_LACSA|nr:hypothetical protein LSAT_V11C400180690 [Lactuca sativa]